MKITLILLFCIANVFAGGCSMLTSYYSAMQSYLSSCKQVGQMPSCFGEPNSSGTPITTATVSLCQGLWTTVQTTGVALANSPFSPTDNLCAYSFADINAKWLPFQSTLNNNISFGLQNPCKDTNIQLLQINKFVFANMCSF
jgi:hypothetical protein